MLLAALVAGGCDPAAGPPARTGADAHADAVSGQPDGPWPDARREAGPLPPEGAAPFDAGPGEDARRSDAPADRPVLPEAGGRDGGVDLPPARDAAGCPSATGACLDEGRTPPLLYVVPYCQRGYLWPDPVEVCWSALPPALVARAREVEAVVHEQLARPARLQFTGFGLCGAPLPARPRVVVSFGDRIAADLGAGGTTDRQVTLPGHFAGPALADAAIQAFLRVLGLEPRTCSREIVAARGGVPERLTTGEHGGLELYYGRRGNGALVATGARCLAPGAEAGDGARAVTLERCPPRGAAGFRFDAAGRLHAAASPGALLEADPATGALRLAPAGSGGAAAGRIFQLGAAQLRSHAGRCLVPTGGEAGAELVVDACSTPEAGGWRLDPARGAFRRGDRCLAVADGIAAPRTPIVVEPCTNAPAQRFSFRASGQIAFGEGDRALCWQVHGGDIRDARKARVALAACAPPTPPDLHQLFSLRGRLELDGRCLEAPVDAGAPARPTLAPCGDREGQRFDVHLLPVAPEAP